MPGSERSVVRWIVVLLLAATALVGTAQIAFLPPWEGFDETAHWSYIQELSDAGRAPRYGADQLSADIAAYPGPMSYATSGRLTYQGYRLAGARELRGGPTRYAGAAGLNWEAQHPPLYYALMSPLYRAAHGLGWTDHLLALRLASFALAFAGLALGVFGTLRVLNPANPWTGPIMAAWPFLFPQFFPEFARLGNDSACLLLMAAAWVTMLRLLTGQGRWASALGLGLSLGLGLLTKALFLPIGAGVGVMLLIHWWSTGRRGVVLGRAAAAAAVALALGGWWYLDRALQTGALTGADEFIRLNHAGGLAALVRGFSLTGLARGLAVIPATFAWAGTWSLARFPEIFLLPILALFGLTLVDYARGLRREDLVGWAPIALAAPVLAGLIYHVLVAMAGAGAATPGWYLHILAAPLGLIVARGWKRPRILTALTAYTGLYAAAAWAFQLSLFSGCAGKTMLDKQYSLAGSGCFIDPRVLAGLGHPLLGAVCLAAGGGLAVAAGLQVWRARRAQRTLLL